MALRTLTTTGQQIVDILATDEDMVRLAKQADYPTTRNDYAGYMSKIQQTEKVLGSSMKNLSGEAGYQIAAQALIKAGANERGVLDALAILTGSGLSV